MQLKTKFLIFFVPISLVSGGLITLLTKKAVHTIVIDEVEKRGLSKAADVAGQMVEGFRTGSERLLLPYLQMSQEHVGAVYAIALDNGGKVLAHTNVLETGKVYNDEETKTALAADHSRSQYNGSDPQVLDMSLPIWQPEENLLFSGGKDKKDRLGTMRLGLPLKEALETEKRITRQILTIISVIGGLALILALFFIRTVLLSVQLLAKGTERISKGEYGVAVPILSKDELGELARNFNKMSTDLSETINKLKEAQDKVIQTEKLAAIGQLAAGVGHELRNPLGAINNALYYIGDVLKGNPLSQEDPTVMDFIQLADREIKNSTKIINDLLDFSRVVNLNLRMTNIKSLLSELDSIINIPDNVKLVKKFDDSIPEVMVDPDRMRQIYINLANNAVQAMPEGGELVIETRLEGNPNNGDCYVETLFKDTGVGISPEHVKRIFEALFTTKAKGSGLGLAICKQIIEKHGGEILVDSKVGEGSVFTVKFPVRN